MEYLTYKELRDLQKSIQLWIQENTSVGEDSNILIVSYGSLNKRCRTKVFKETTQYRLELKVSNFLEKIFFKNKLFLHLLKFDLVKNIQEKEIKALLDDIKSTKHNNHYRKGISLDINFEICFLEQEIYGYSIIKGNSFNEPNFIEPKNLKIGIKEKYPEIQPDILLKNLKKIWVFDTTSVFYENKNLIKLQSEKCENGVRAINENLKEHIKSIITNNAAYLYEQILDNGKFIYGYFPAFNNKIKSYNTVRHCTSIYALLETFEVLENPSYWDKIHLAIQYSLDNFYKVTDKNTAHMIDSTASNPEIKLGSNAAAILMLTKYQEITECNQYQKYAECLANGILNMIDAEGKTTHVLEFPSLKIKEKFRIVYYDGEAALALLRLYQINKNSKLIETVKLMFENFISKSYEKYHDHWLSYCTNELTKFCPDERYYLFGIKNYLNHMDFIKNRKTAYATLLEMMMSAYKMICRLNEQGYEHLFSLSNFDELKNLIELRVEFQRTGFFYPEVAMYMKKPDQILNSFYVRHDRFRTRIDDQEHNLSGYIAYYLHFKE
ncbi:poly alpha-glucosyltransferase [Acinetobacter venetianus]|uniref:poly alpha-glucosyltransferase n=1 Tax=Acinetobacter venetianus TaxID=52133 RepID=UPI00214FD01C|nr:poly alpha-glucosyltransferase [Acinetobacter venetianus]MCR4532676.1 poly alpha-glucosyltransferase [Acinetobacter venetianus]